MCPVAWQHPIQSTVKPHFLEPSPTLTNTSPNPIIFSNTFPETPFSSSSSASLSLQFAQLEMCAWYFTTEHWQCQLYKHILKILASTHLHTSYFPLHLKLLLLISWKSFHFLKNISAIKYYGIYSYPLLFLWHNAICTWLPPRHYILEIFAIRMSSFIFLM